MLNPAMMPAAAESYRAVSVALDSRTTVTLICPGYVSSSSICLTMSRARTWGCNVVHHVGRHHDSNLPTGLHSEHFLDPSRAPAISSMRSSRCT